MHSHAISRWSEIVIWENGHVILHWQVQDGTRVVGAYIPTKLTEAGEYPFRQDRNPEEVLKNTRKKSHESQESARCHRKQ